MARRHSAWRSPHCRDRWGLVALGVVSSCGSSARRPPRRRPTHNPTADAAKSPRRSTSSRRTGCRSSASSARSRSASRSSSRRGRSSRRNWPPDPRRRLVRSRRAQLRAIYLTERGDAFVDLSATPDRAYRRRARRALHGLRDRQRATTTCRRSSACRSSSRARRSTRWPDTSTSGIHCRRT